MPPSKQPETEPRTPGPMSRYAWLPIPLLLAVIAGLWAADLRAVYESRTVMVLLNLIFTLPASLSICVLTARAFLTTGQPGLLMFGCGSLLWGYTSLIAATLVDDANVNPTITVHNIGVFGAALCHFAGLMWRGRRPRPGKWLAAGYAAGLTITAMIVWAAMAGLIPVFFVQGHGGTPLRQIVLLSATALFAWVAGQMIYKIRTQPRAFFYWYGLGLALVATGLTGVMLLSVQGGILGWTNRLTQYLGSAYLFIAAVSAAREAGTWTFSQTAIKEEAVRRSQQIFHELIERSPFGTYVVDSQFRIAIMNTASQAGAFRNVQPLIGRDFSEAMRTLWPEEVAMEIIGHFRHTLDTGEPYYSRDFINPRHDDDIVEAYEWELHRMTLPDGLYGVICYYYDSTKLRQSEAALRMNEERLRLVLQASSIGSFEVELQTDEGRWNDVEYELLGLKPGDVPAGPELFFQYVHPDDVGFLKADWADALRTGEFDTEFRIIRADGQERWLAGKGRFIYDGGGDGRASRFLGVNYDITERKQAETFRSMGQDILLVLSEDINLKKAIKRVFDIIKSAAGVDAMGIRLQDEDDFPYFYQEGFPEDFLSKENSLLARTKDGGICRDECGNICLECTCGLVVTCKTDPSSPLFTKGGSSWTNDSFPFLHVPAEDDPRTNPRNECIHQGFASVALIPIRAKGRVVGLLQLNDRRKGCFTLEGIETLEKIAENIGESMLRKQAEETQRESQERLALAADAGQVGMFDLNMATGDLQWTQQHEVIFGYEPTTTTTTTTTTTRTYRDWADRVHPEDLPMVEGRMSQAMEERVPFQLEYRLVWPDNSLHWVNVTSKYYFDDSGRCTRLMGAVRYITNQKLAEVALKESETKYRELVQNANSVIIRWRCDGTLVFFNEYAQSLFGYGADEIIGRDVSILVPEKESTGGDLIELIQNIVAHPANYMNNVNENVCRDGHRIWLAWTNKPIFDEQGRVAEILAVGVDITERKQAESILRFLGQCGCNESREDFFHDLARYLASTLDMDFVCIDRLEDDRLSAETLAVFHNSQFEDNVSYTLKDTPCGDVVGKNICSFPKNVCGLFPKDEVLQDLQAESYLGTTLWSSQGKPIGLIAVIGRQPLEDTRRGESVLQLVAVRAAGELERMQAEEVLRQNEERLRLALTASKMASWDWHVPSGETVWNEIHYRMMGYEPGEVTPSYQSWASRVHPEDIDATQAEIQRCMAERLFYTSTFRTLWPDGSIRWLVASGEFEYDAENQPLRCYGVMIDITERKQAEESVRKIHAELELRIEERTSELAEAVKILEEEILERQKAELNLQRLNRLYTVLGETNQTIVKISDRDSLFRDFCRIAVEHGGFVLSWIGLIDGQSGKVNTVASSGATAYLNDILITTKNEPEGEGPTGISIRNGTYYICNDFQNAPCTRPWHDQGKKYGIFASASIAIKENDRVIGALTLYGGEKDYFDAQQVELLLQMGMDISFALDNLNRENSRKEAEKALYEETAERLQATEALREKERMLLQQSRQAAMGEMIGNIAHQWRQPINTLGLVVQQLLLFYDMGEFNRELLEKNVTISKNLIKHMSKTIDDFRNFFRPDKEKIEFKVTEAIASTLSLIEDSFNNQHIAVEVVAKDDPSVLGHRNEFAQALLNILNNARDALIERQTRNPRVTITICRESGRAVITISDNAGGVPEEIMGKIFDPYFTTKGPQNGTGVGLFMTKAIIEKNMGGRLAACNAGEGAEFRIEI